MKKKEGEIYEKVTLSHDCKMSVKIIILILTWTRALFNINRLGGVFTAVFLVRMWMNAERSLGHPTDFNTDRSFFLL